MYKIMFKNKGYLKQIPVIEDDLCQMIAKNIHLAYSGTQNRCVFKSV